MSLPDPLLEAVSAYLNVGLGDPPEEFALLPEADLAELRERARDVLFERVLEECSAYFRSGW